MLKKYLSPKFIIIFCFIVSIAELINDQFFTTINSNIVIAKQFINPLNLDWILSRDLMASNGLNSINAIFDVLLLLGAILYTFNKTKETRLIRFVISVIFMSNVLSLVYSAAFILFVKTDRPISSILLNVAFYIAHSCWIYLSYNILQYFNTQKDLQTDVIEQGDVVHTYFTEASKWYRVLHPIIDVIVTIMLFSPMGQLVAYIKFGQPMFFRMAYNSNPGMVLFDIAVCRLVYYLLFEGILGITPAKLLTETRVINYEGNKPALKNVAVRTVSRFIPFESISFFLHNGLHDKLSGTLVVKEKRTGVDGSYFFWIFPAIIALYFFSRMICGEYEMYKEKQQYEAKRERIKGDLIWKFQRVTTNDFFQLKHSSDQIVSNFYTSDFLKVEHITDTAIICSILKVDVGNYRQPTQADVEKNYSENKKVLLMDTISKTNLLAALSPGDSYYGLSDSIVPIKIAGVKYLIKSIDTYFMPNIQVENSGFGENYLDIFLANKGWTADLINIQVLEGNIKITTPLPVHLKGFGQRIEGTANGDNVNYKLNITVMDTLGRKQIYRVTGNTSRGGDVSIRSIR